MISSQFIPITEDASSFLSTRHIPTKKNANLWLQKASDSTWIKLQFEEYDLINNSLVTNEIVQASLYVQVELRVADTEDELGIAPSDIAIVSASVADVNTVANNIDSININAENIVDIQNAESYKNETISNLALTNADVVLTHADVVLTHADVITTTADRISSTASKDAAGVSEVLASEWADKATEVVTGRDSAKTWAGRAEASAIRAEQFDPDVVRTATPTFTISLTVNENSVTQGSIDLYDAGITYVIQALNGTIEQLGGVFNYTAPDLIGGIDGSDTIFIYAIESGKLQSYTTSQDLVIKFVNVIADTAIQVVDFTNEAQINDGWSLI